MISHDTRAVSSSDAAVRERLGAYLELTKPRITTLLLIVAVAGYFAAGGRSFAGFIVTAATVLSVGAGIFALNQYFERSTDALMMRTKRRPVPSGRIDPRRALVFGIAFSAASLVIAGLAGNEFTGILTLGVIVSYLGVYTPLKRVTALHTLVGAIPGAAPPLIGWAVATGGLSVDAWIFFGVLFFWQFPHFLAIETMYAEDYARAGIRVLPNSRRGWWPAALEIAVTLVSLVAVSVLPWVTGLAGRGYAITAIVLGIGFTAAGVRLIFAREKMHARHLLRASIIYLPLVFILLFTFAT